MKKFDLQQFCNDLIKCRGNESQESFSKKMQVKRSTLSLLENGKQIPNIEILNNLCNLYGKNPNDYFCESKTDSLVYLMGRLNEDDKNKIEEMIKNIRITEKYELLSRRGRYVNN